MSVLDGIIQGIIQGLTEFLPVSSSGHLSLYQYFAGGGQGGSLFFSLMLHLGTLVAVIAAYYKDLWAMLVQVGLMFKELFTGKFHWKTENTDRKMLYMLFFACLPMLLLVFVNPLVSKVAEDNDIIAEGVCFLVTSLLLFAACRMKPGRAGVGRMRPKQALAIGVMQSLAALPGISRSGSTISTGLILGFDRSFMVKFSFLLGIPAILGGVVFEVGDAVAQKAKVDVWPLVAGMLTAAVVGYGCIVLIRWLVLSDKFVIFAWYTLFLGIVVIVLGILGHINGWGTPTPAPAPTAAAIGTPHFWGQLVPGI